jgi:Tol biopolymer transport system component
MWDMREKKLVDLPTINDSPNAQLHPSLAGDGKLLAFAVWNRPNSSQRWDVFLYDTVGKTIVPLLDANSLRYDERMPALSGDGRWLAFATNADGGSGVTDIRLHQWRDGQTDLLPKMNSPHQDIEPSLSFDGRLMAFVSDRPV